MGSDLRWSDDALLELCRRNPELRIERTARGDLAVMTPDGGASSRRNARVVAALVDCADEDGTGAVYDASDGLPELRAKMAEYLANGARLGWLLDTLERRVSVYRPGQRFEIQDQPTQISGSPELPGFVLDLQPIWQAG